VDEAEVTKRIAIAKYAIKVGGYLGLDVVEFEKVFEKVFEKLYANMKRVFEGTSYPEIDEIMVLMAREIVEDLCEGVSVEGRPKCLQILHRILTRGEGVERLSELSNEDRMVIKENLKHLGIIWKT